jgi:hypothetical protein
MVYGDLNSDGAASRFARGKGVSVVPTMMLVSADGVEIERWVGTRTAQDLANALDRALASP